MAYIGIDVSKQHLDIFLDSSPLRLTNSDAGVADLVSRLRADDIIVMEASGGCERSAATALRAAGFGVCIVNPAEVAFFRKGMGKLAKTDAIDAQVLAHFGLCRRPKPKASTDHPELRDACTRRRQLVDMRSDEKKRLHQIGPTGRESIGRVVAALDDEIALLDARIAELIALSPELKAKSAALQSVRGIGKVIAATLLAAMPEIGMLSRREIASLAGLAPHPRDSGQMRGVRMIRGGRREVRRMLYVAALVAKQFDPDIRKFYESLLARGKAVKQALIACARKILIIANARVREAP